MMEPMIVNSQRRIPVAVAPLAKFADRARRELSFPEDGVTVRLVSDQAMARLNRSFRGKRGPTDVLSFPARVNYKAPLSTKRRAPVAGGWTYVGDIAISPQTARRNARLQARGLPTELRILILHGMIHLAGYDHETDHGEMHRIERRLRRRLGLEE
jgi:probable rRNA maturation factor